jgi:hypothetical protein
VLDQIIIDKQVTAAIVGGFIAGCTGWFIDWKRENRKFQALRNFLITGICDDLQHSVGLFDKIHEEYEKTGIIYFTTLNELKESRYVYHNNKDWMAIFDDGDLRKKIFKYYLQSNNAIHMLEFFQQRKYDIEARVDELAIKIKSENPTFSQEEALKQAIGYMSKEHTEYENLPKHISQFANKLKDFKTTAETIITKLKTIQ